MLVLAYILCPIFKLKYKSVRIYSRKYAYILRSVHDHVSGTVALFLLYEASIGRLGDFDHLTKARAFGIEIDDQEIGFVKRSCTREEGMQLDAA